MWQDWSSSPVMASIKTMIPDECFLIRDGAQVSTMTADVVPGDILLLNAGDKLPADVRFTNISSDAKFDRSILTVADCVSVVVAFISESLPVALTASLTISANMMRKNKVLCKSLKTVETLGAVSVICSDKTGTLTEVTPDTARDILVADRSTSGNLASDALDQLRSVAGLYLKRCWTTKFNLAFDSKNKFMIRLIGFTRPDGLSLAIPSSNAGISEPGFSHHQGSPGDLARPVLQVTGDFALNAQAIAREWVRHPRNRDLVFYVVLVSRAKRDPLWGAVVLVWQPPRPGLLRPEAKRGNSIYFIDLIVMQWFNLLAVRARRLSIFQHPPLFKRETMNSFLFPAILFALVMTFSGCIIPSLQSTVGTAQVGGILLFDESRKFLSGLRQQHSLHGG
ncbi:hypothetical protein B0H63DRAFT_536275 [Podospora didyma]|uniref:Uncharacterized protein n=1 Tax=Podospora didyma TaxID=330526 RepID=A0AAE0JXV2_9PEZI|nr:hypothetical protein B0H63DRAFT_536275 [Podospora didyma]